MKLARVFLCLLVIGVAGLNDLLGQQVFEVNLNDRTGDTFKVTVYPAHLSAANNVFQFAATAPGTYQVMDIGRFVAGFTAFDRSGKEIPASHNSTNQWTISRPEDVQKITYTVADIWNTKVTKDPIYPMASTTLSDDFAMINGQAVFGYFSGMQSEPVRIKLLYPSAWVVGTALRRDNEGFYEAEDFDKVVDSPFYLGKLTTATTTVGGAEIDVYTYSQKGLITSDAMLASLQSILKAESDFTKGLPVDRYAFLFYFGTFSAGAWEHSYSSEYVMREDTLKPQYASAIVSIIAHEFFHVNTPLNIHSELVERFNFVKPVMSQHLWLYEGTTEWAAHILQLRDSLITLAQYLQTIQGEMSANDRYDPSLSLTALGVHSTERQDQYPNIYQKGALVSTLLDIRLLQLSHGTMGLRELLIRLSKQFGKNRSFSEGKFFDQLTSMTYPEIGDFFARYVQGTEELPVKEYFGWLGIDYRAKGDPDSSRSDLGVALGLVDNAIGVTAVFSDSKSGLMKGDVIEKVDTTALTFQTAGPLFRRMTAMKPGSTITMAVKRQGKEMEVTAVLIPRVVRHIFSLAPHATPEQLRLRDAWMRNM